MSRWVGKGLATKQQNNKKEKKMKKLMIAACAAAMAMGAQAATDSWTFNLSENGYSVKDGYKATTVGGTSSNPVGAGFKVYYIASSGAGSDARGADYSALLQGLRAGKSVQEAIAANKGLSLLAQSVTDEKGIVAAVTADVDTSLYSPNDTVGGNSVWLYCLSLITAPEPNDFVYLAEGGKNSTKTSTHSGGTYYFTSTLADNDGTTAYSSFGWYSTVPEPTSGLLMLMGGMLLGLRRKRV